MPIVEVERTYLELRVPADLTSSRTSPPHAPSLAHVSPISAAAYRVLYRAVGEQWHWHDRLRWSDDQLQVYLDRIDVQVWVLGVLDDPEGYFELERQTDGSIEIVYFGLVPRAMERGLGAWMLTCAVQRAWAAGASRVWLHTCTLDSPRALPNYIARGFREFKRERYTTNLAEPADQIR